jgi:isoleucyl-tRNA synthetase
MAAARDGQVEIRADGSVQLAGEVLAADEVEILATPRPGSVVAHDDGLLVVIDTELTADLRAEGDARELQRAIQDLRKEAALELDDRIELHIAGLADDVAAHLHGVVEATLAELVEGLPPEAPRATVALDAGPVTIALRRRPGPDAAAGSGS